MKLSVPSRIKIVEVGPRDGLQNERKVLPAEAKIGFVDLLTEAGLSHIEVTSFVSPRWVPQLADGAEVYAAVKKAPEVVYSALVPNLFGMERALAAGVRYVAVFTAASETFNQHNINASIDESLERFEAVCERAEAEHIPVRGYVSTSFGCPYEGTVAPEKVADVTAALFQMGCVEVSLGDTVGVADPVLVVDVIDAVAQVAPIDRIAVHLHDTHGRGLANAFAALQAGVTIMDTSAGGLGGCPYAPGATGNLATEDLVSMLHHMGIETGVDVAKVAAASFFMEQQLGRPLPSRHLQTLRTRPT